jgi:predicted HTH transcriptional regulator
VPSEALESSPNDFSVKSNDIPLSNSTPTEAINEPKTDEKQAPNESNPEPVSEPMESPEPQTAQIPVNEPLVKISLARELLVKARNMIQFRKRKKLDRVMTLFLKQSKITNDEVEKFLHVSDATATRYLSQLEKENKIKQTGKTGHMVSYSRI